MRAPVPTEARKVAHYWYSDGNELAVYVTSRAYYVRDGVTGDYPLCPVRHVPHPHPAEGGEYLDFDYETLGLYYQFEMAGTGWDGDC